MATTDGLQRRGQALENQYFQRVDQQLLERLRREKEKRKELGKLARAAGLHDDDVAQHLLDSGIDASNVAALTLTPLVFVAWASGTVTTEERRGVISAALRRGVNSNATAFQLLEQWLHTQPRRELWNAWAEYATEVHRSLPELTAAKLKRRLIEQAERVALASGGFLGIGKISAAEQRVIDEIDHILES
ncbi:MAG: hypothetical protein AAFV88_02430 [Planctomycetota bacterium]